MCLRTFSISYRECLSGPRKCISGGISSGWGEAGNCHLGIRLSQRSHHHPIQQNVSSAPINPAPPCQVKQSDTSVPPFAVYSAWLQGKCSRPINYHRIIRDGEIQAQIKSAPPPTYPRTPPGLPEILGHAVTPRHPLPAAPTRLSQASAKVPRGERSPAQACPGCSSHVGIPIESLLPPTPAVWGTLRSHVLAPHPQSSEGLSPFPPPHGDDGNHRIG